MDVMILCGGKGTRLQEDRPKPLVEIGGRPILWHIMKMYRRQLEWDIPSFAEGADFVLCLGYKSWDIKQYFLTYPYRECDFEVNMYSPKHTEMLSYIQSFRVKLIETGLTSETGLRIAKAAKYIKDKQFCLTYGDGLSDVNLVEVIKFHRKHGKLLTVTGVHPTARFGTMEVEGDKALHFQEKLPKEDEWVNGGFFVMEKAFVTKYLSDTSNSSLENGPLQQAALDGELMVYKHRGFWQPMDTPKDRAILEDLWASGQPPWFQGEDITPYLK